MDKQFSLNILLKPKVIFGFLSFAALMVSFHTIRAARANPADSLRYE
jgi:hypothetical protein